MSRQISFNAWLPQLGFMLKDVAVGHGQIGVPFIDEPEDEFYQFLKSKNLISQDEDQLPEWMYDSGEDWCTIMGDEHFILLQFTGLKDKNGVEVYEGDIVRINHPDDLTGDFTDAIGYVFWYNNEAAFYHTNNNDRPPKRMWDHVEVIGNIYENPELLKP